jgi:hypothetical protein
MTTGAGECCVVMAIFTYFLSDLWKFLTPSKKKNYWLLQNLIWIMWTCVEFYYTYTGIEPLFIGCTHVILCCIVWSMAYTNMCNTKIIA